MAVLRPPVIFGCRGGRNNAPESRFEEQRALARRATAWYQNYVALLRRLRSGRTPTAVVGFSGQGGVSEGVRRANGASHGQDLRDQPRYSARFGSENFSKGDSTSPSELRDLKRRSKAFVLMLSPPCKASSSALMRGNPSEPKLISQARSAALEVGGKYVIENVVGAKAELSADSCLLRGAYFGEHVDRPRFFENNFGLRVDEALKVGGDSLRRGTCLGIRRRWKRLDSFGRPCLTDCCAGNIWAVQGDKPLRCTACECARAMGLDEDHMDYEGMAQAIPPVYSQYLFGMACMKEVESEFGIPAISFDEMLAHTTRSRRRMAHWLRGAGGASPHQGVEFERGPSGAAGEAADAEQAAAGGAQKETATATGETHQFVEEEGGPPQRHGFGTPARGTPPADSSWSCQAPASSSADPSPPPLTFGEARQLPGYAPVHKDQTGDEVLPPSELTVRDAELREVWYSWAGDFDLVVGPEEARAALRPIRPHRGQAQLPSRDQLIGHNTLLLVSGEVLRKGVASWGEAAARSRGTRVCVEARGREAERLLVRSGFRLVRRVRLGSSSYATGSSDALSGDARSYWSAGCTASEGGVRVDYEKAEAHMDPLDRSGAEQEPKAAKEARSYMPIPWERERWDIGLPDELDRAMARQGVGIYPVVEPGFSEVPFYPWSNREGLFESIAEADRALTAGAMEYVPASRIAEVMASSTIHPWTIVDQGGGKWRLCHDYSVGTNRQVPTAAFVLPTVWDATPTIKEGSHFAKYDIRDGFWHMPIGDDSRKRLVVRHPGTGRLMWASRLPFGYLEAPRLFCGLTEAVAARLRKRAAGRGIHFYVFVDDLLCVGDTEELTREGMRMVEEEFEARGIQWAPHKKRGPCQCIEFLGLLLSNVEGMRGVTITQKRRRKLEAEMAEWAAREPDDDSEIEVDPTTLASLLGKLVFVSQVVKGGRTYMQGMLSSFQGLVVDWHRGSVAPVGGRWEKMRVGQRFFRDLHWWLDHLETRSLASFGSKSAKADGVLAGTDASGWGTGQVLWLHGAREESVLRFTAAEKRRPINWRELLGIVRAAELGGERLRGLVLLVETDNMAAKGAASKLSSKAEDMQELVRRLLRVSERHGFEIRVSHTPGEKLDRPDQTSRGDAEEEPRARLTRPLFSHLEARWGGFTGFLGAEREHASPSPREAVDASKRLWVHPTVSTVGTALRRVQEAIVEGGVSSTTALALVPDDDAPAWSKLLRHGLVVGRVARGEGKCLEVNSLGEWRPCIVQRPMRFVIFPRAAGAMVKRVQLTVDQGIEIVRVPSPSGEARVTTRGEGYTTTEEGDMLLPLLPGSFVYSLAQVEGGRGALYQVAPESRRGGFGQHEVVLIYAEQTKAKAAVKLSSFPVYDVSKAERAELHRPDPSELWTVDHLVTGLPGGVTFDRFSFDASQAEAQIRAAGGRWGDGLSRDWVMLSPEATPGSASSGPASGYVPFTASAIASAHGGEDGAEGLEAVVRDLDRLHLEQSSVKTGSEGALQPRSFGERGGESLGERGSVRQPCQHEGIRCGGCDAQFRIGETMLTRGTCLLHDCASCIERYDIRLAARVSFEVDEALRNTTVYYGVYSDAPGAPGVYTDWEEVQAITEHETAESNAVSYAACSSMAEAQEFVRTSTLARVSEIDSYNRQNGSITLRTHIAEKLGPKRIAMIRNCIAGCCGHDHGPASSTLCRGGCGRKLHMVTCAQLGKGFAALGNFTCVECRCQKILVQGVQASEEVKANVEKTMIMEMSQGAESTAGGFAEYTRLEREYVLGFGKILDGDTCLHLPRHNAEAYKNFLTWLTMGIGRVLSLESFDRTASSFFSKLQIANVTKDSGVKQHRKELTAKMGVEHTPADTATPRMLKYMVEKGCAKRFVNPFLVARERVQIVAEGAGGCRIGEVCGGGDCHGLLANNTCILEDIAMKPGTESIETQRVVVEMKLEHSKTKFSRYLDVAGTTETSRIEFASIVSDYWKEAGMATTVEVVAGVKVTRPDFWVARVNLLGVRCDEDADEFFELLEHLRNSQIPTVQATLGGVIADAKSRYKASGVGSQEKKYINVAMGRKNDKGLNQIAKELDALGFEVSIIPGPLLLATTGGKYGKVKTMPLSSSTTFTPTKEILTEAWKAVCCDPHDPDPDLEIPQGQEPKWSTHSLRRLADTVARRYREVTGVTEDEIDLYFGWNERVLLKAMQVHYATLSIRERMKHAKITGML